MFIFNTYNTLNLKEKIYSINIWHVKRCNIVCGNICVVYRNIYGLKHIFMD